MPDIYISPTDVRKKEERKKEPWDSHAANPSIDDPGEERHRMRGHSHNPLSAFLSWPDRVNFETQDRDERIVLMLRKHLITNVPWIILTIILIFAPSLLSFFPLLDFLPTHFQFVALLFWYLIVTAFFLESFLTWFFNVYLVTDERIIDIDFYNLIYREVTDAKLDKIQDVTYTLGGVVRTIFNYGDVVVQTAGTVPNIEFQAVPDPAEVARILQELRTQEEQEVLEGRVR